MYLADFWSNFLRFFDCFLFNCLKWVLKRVLLLEQFLDNNFLFCGYKVFLIRNMTKKLQNFKLFFLIFFGVFLLLIFIHIC